MRTLIFDIEANDLLPKVHTIHCIAILDKETKQLYKFGPDQIDEALDLLATGQVLVAHNGLGYDLEALIKVKGWRPTKGTRVRDTLVRARLAHSDMMEQDHKSWEAQDDEDAEHLRGAHSLEGWGKRLGVLKSEYTGGFEVFTPEMLDYCGQDVVVADRLDDYIISQNLPEPAALLEEKFAFYTGRGCEKGFPFNVEKGQKLADEVATKAAAAVMEIAEIIPATTLVKATPEYWTLVHQGVEHRFTTKGECDTHRKAQKWKPKECEVVRGPSKTEIVYFNPGSGKQVLTHFREKYGYLSPILTDKGQELYKAKEGTYTEIAQNYGSFPEELLRGLKWPEAKMIADYKLLVKRLGQIQNGKNAWLKVVHPDGRIRHSLFGIGCVTHRVAHRSPNLGQVPSVEVNKEKQVVMGIEGRYGWESRELFYAPEGYRLVGVDMSGIEARCLAHFLFPFDNGKYVDTVLNGDIHQMNADAFKVLAGYTITRKDVKTPFYAFTYAAGLEKLGTVVSEMSTEANEEFEFWRDWMQSKGRDITGTRRMASLIAFGSERPENPNDTEFTKLIRWISRVAPDNVQVTTKLARKVVGGKVNMAFRKGITGLDKLIESVTEQAKQGYIVGLDGRKLPVRKEHAALNTLLQGNAAIIGKKWCVLTFDQATKRQIDAWCAAYVHDEIQSIVETPRAEEHRDYCLDSVKRAGLHFNLNIPLDGDGKIGDNWAETH